MDEATANVDFDTDAQVWCMVYGVYVYICSSYIYMKYGRDIYSVGTIFDVNAILNTQYYDTILRY